MKNRVKICENQTGDTGQPLAVKGRVKCCELQTADVICEIIEYIPKFDEYIIPIHDGGSSGIVIKYCPWCGRKLPESKRNLWFDTLEKIGFDEPFDEDIPPEFKTGEWYLKSDVEKQNIQPPSAEKLHTTPMGTERIKRNLKLDVDDVVEWCREFVKNAPETAFSREGKNWYVKCEGVVLTINANSYTIITAHRIK